LQCRARGDQAPVRGEAWRTRGQRSAASAQLKLGLVPEQAPKQKHAGSEPGSARGPAIAVDELLLAPPRRTVDLGHARDLAERAAELGMDLIGAVADDLEAAAALRPGGPEGRHHDVAPGLEPASRGRHVAVARGVFRKKMKDGAVVPEIIRTL